jgi:hypothetical protein
MVAASATAQAQFMTSYPTYPAVIVIHRRRSTS